LTKNRLTLIFYASEPLLWVEEETQTVRVESETLERFHKWLDTRRDISSFEEMMRRGQPELDAAGLARYFDFYLE
jgi:hypothetical protein